MNDKDQTSMLPRIFNDHPEQAVVENESFCIGTPEAANWLIRKVVEHRRYRERVQAWAEVEVRKAEADEQHLLCRFGSQLECWLRKELAERGGRRRSLELPAGTIGFRAQQTRLLVDDESELIKWCRSHLPQALQVRVEASGTDAIELEQWSMNRGEDVHVTNCVGKAIINEYFASTGDQPQGVEILPPGDVLSVK